ncbi:histidine phosphatase family protein [Synechococcus sp. NOUM97013]|uniref:histidine phosphatase family protein n=1 Tax=Synechococcus sp. NOUM97013 TaxID=1442555 RepID=UPI001645A228|nr:histidine phosphatase family protein [Synechococcus sp. NOUM97013]QNI74123.1 phosphoserine phosphatase [Synechococcus sp. NOUM97013]
MSLRLLLVRHGLSSFNMERRIQGRDDLSTLTTTGEEQARRTGQALADVPVTAVYSSPLKRAASTATGVLAERSDNLSPSFDDGLLEIDLEPWSGLTADERAERFPEEFATWKRQPEALELTRADGRRYKPLQDLMQQAREFLDALIRKHPVDGNDTVLIVGHNAILRCLIVTLLGEPEQGFRRLRLDNASLSIFNLSPKADGHQVQIECLNSTAHLEPPLPSKGKGARLILVRHGETNWNRDGRFQGQIDIPLNSNGHAQAEAARGFLADVPIQKAISSSMTRPRETAEGILKSHPGVTLEQTDGLVEIGHGLWEGKLESEIKAEWGDLLEEWKRTPETVQMPEGETIQDVWERSVQSWNTIANGLDSAETALVVAHDAVNKTILCHLLGLTPADIWAVKQGNGGVTVVDMPTEPGQPAVVACLNLTSHLGGVLDRTAAGAL